MMSRLDPAHARTWPASNLNLTPTIPIQNIHSTPIISISWNALQRLYFHDDVSLLEKYWLFVFFMRESLWKTTKRTRGRIDACLGVPNHLSPPGSQASEASKSTYRLLNTQKRISCLRCQENRFGQTYTERINIWIESVTGRRARGKRHVFTTALNTKTLGWLLKAQDKKAVNVNQRPFKTRKWPGLYCHWLITEWWKMFLW